jgi:hypothetical protein
MINQGHPPVISSIRDPMLASPQRHVPDIPESKCVVMRTRDNSLAIRRESYGRDHILVPLERADHSLSFLDVPDSDSVVKRTRDNSFSIKRESYCPWRGPTTVSPFSTSQTRIVLSLEPETIRFPSGEKATDVTLSWCPWRGPTTVSFLDVPDSDSVVIRTRDNSLPIRGESYGRDTTLVSTQDLELS